MGKNIVICCDGTGNEPSDRFHTNVFKLYKMLKEEIETQHVYYDAGVGTSGVTEVYGLITGFGLSKNIKQAYEFLMSNYNEGDKVFLFGFSRGAYTVRCLAGIIKKNGLLLRGNIDLIDNEINRYFDSPLSGLTELTIDCNIHVVGVWDTVAAFIPIPPHHKFRNNDLNPNIPFGFQALAIDEKRKNYKPELWNETYLTNNGQTIEQVWFAGVHSDVGGSNSSAGLSDISLDWMIDNVKKNGLIMKENYQDGIKKNVEDNIQESYKGVWLVRPKFIREIPLGSKIHCSVLERIIRKIDNNSLIQLPRNPHELRENYTIVGDCEVIDE